MSDSWACIISQDIIAYLVQVPKLIQQVFIKDLCVVRHQYP